MRYAPACLLVAALIAAPCAARAGVDADAGRCANREAPAPARLAACTRALDSTALAPEARAAVLFERGIAHEQTGAPGRALADYDEALRLRPDHAQALANRGAVHAAKGEYDLAIADYDEAIRLDNDRIATVNAYNNRGNAYYRKGEYARAVRDYDRTVEMVPRYPTAYLMRGLARFDLGRFAESVPDFAQTGAMMPGDPYVSLWLYTARARAGEAEAARTELARRAARFDPIAWPGPMISYLLGDIDAARLHHIVERGSRKRRQAKRCLADFFYAQALIVQSGAPSAASMEIITQSLRRVATECSPDLLQHAAAKAELARLGAEAITRP